MWMKGRIESVLLDCKKSQQFFSNRTLKTMICSTANVLLNNSLADDQILACFENFLQYNPSSPFLLLPVSRLIQKNRDVGVQY